MKKSFLLVMVAVAIMVFAMTATAYADTVSGFEPWSNLAPNGGGTDNPHQSYSTTTVKCAVCHAVHKAPTTGQVLLSTSVADSCVVCHITTDTGGKVIYTAVAPDHTNNYSLNAGSFAHNSDGVSVGMTATNVTCVMCHTVHGAGRITGFVSSKILKSANFQTTNGAPSPIIAAQTRDNQITGFCTRCHPYFMDAYTGETVLDPVAGTGPYRSHVMKVAGVYSGSPGANFSGTIAYGPSTQCRDCHDAGLTGQAAGHITNSFPHRTPAAQRFLMAADHFNDTTKVDASDANADGVCLKCHATGVDGSAATGGVGFGF